MWSVNLKAGGNKKATLKNMQYQRESEEDTFNHASVHQCETCHNSS